MMRSSLVWKMAWLNLRSQLRQTLLAVIGGSVGALLVTIAAVLYSSVDHSGERWLDKRFGPIEWELTSKEAGGSMAADLAASILTDMDKRGTGIQTLPLVNSVAAIMRLDATGEAKEAIPGMLVMGIPWDRAAALDPEHEQLWSIRPGDDELVLDAASAKSLNVRVGDSVALDGGNGVRKSYRVAYVAKERGLTGYRGAAGSYEGSILMTERAARQLKGDTGSSYDSILAGRPGTEAGAATPFPYFDPNAKYNVNSIKFVASNKADMKGTLYVFMAISGVAVLSGAVLMHQIMLLLGESRRELFGVFRAIGFSRRQIAAFFMVESGLLSLLSTLVGVVIGTAASSGIVYAFYGAFADTLARISGANVPITLYVSPVGLTATSGAILLFLLALAAIVARKLSKTPIVEALRGAQPDAKPRMRASRWSSRVLMLFAGGVVTVHLALAFGKTPEEVATSDVLTRLGTWLGACIAGLYLVLNAMSRSDRWLSPLLGRMGLSEASILLAARYPKRKPGRTYAISLLFALLMMTASFTSIVFEMVLRTNDVEKNDQTMFGYGAAVAYATPAEHNRILSLASSDPEIARRVQGLTSVEPYMAYMIEQGSGQSMLAMTPELLDAGGLALEERAPKFADDRQAWEAVMTDPRFIVLPLNYRDEAADSTEFDRRRIVKAGDTVKLPVYESKPRGLNEAWVPAAEREFIVAGFSKPESSAGDAMDLYRPTFVHPEVHAEWRKYGIHWPRQSSLGYVLFQLDYKDMQLTHKLEERFAIGGVSGFKVPYATHAAENFMNRQLFRSFVAFSLVSAVIGLCGLAIVQFRSVRERGKQLAMLRCAGLSGRHLSQMFLLEGTTVSWSGLFTGWLIGATGAIGFVRMLLESDGAAPSTSIHYPYELLVPIILVLLLAALLLNIGPARAALRLSPGAAIRAADE